MYGAHGFKDSTSTYTGGNAASRPANHAAAVPATSRASRHVVPISASEPSSAGSLADTREIPSTAYVTAMAYGSQAAAYVWFFSMIGRSPSSTDSAINADKASSPSSNQLDRSSRLRRAANDTRIRPTSAMASQRPPRDRRTRSDAPTRRLSVPALLTRRRRAPARAGAFRESRRRPDDQTAAPRAPRPRSLQRAPCRPARCAARQRPVEQPRR